MEIDLEILIQKITRQVINELESRGVRVASATPPAECRSGQGVEQARSERPDLSAYKTPVLTERHVRMLQSGTCRIIVPAGTLISPRAGEILKEKNIRVQTE
jgi:hypothetical protein